MNFTNWASREERELYMMGVILDGDAPLDRMAQIVGTDDFQGLAADALRAALAATTSADDAGADVDPGEWDVAVNLARAAVDVLTAAYLSPEVQ